jgi:hypothetical protein
MVLHGTLNRSLRIGSFVLKLERRHLNILEVIHYSTNIKNSDSSTTTTSIHQNVQQDATYKQVNNNVEDSSELQPEWATLERRLQNRVPKHLGTSPQGRTNKRSSAWDAENV